MAAVVDNSSRRGWHQRRLMSEINITPVVDVMLVLLVIFMITAPLLTVGVNVDLPEAGVPEIRGQDEPLAVSINADGVIYLQNTEVALDELGPRLEAVTERKSDVRIFVRGDRAIDYGLVMEVMGAITEAGFDNVALIAELPGGKIRR
ncbi:MAG: protein TolR [Alphaproteobacteria bacterium]